MATSSLFAISPVLSVIDGKATTTSIDVAKLFGKIHRDVVRAIENLLPQLGEMGLLNFAHTPITNEQNGETYSAYTITRDGFALLAMGFTGKRALQFKLAYIDAFNKMESALLTSAAQPYTAQPQDKLSAGEQDILRDMLTSAVKRLPPARQAGAMIKGWSKLKSHFGVNYRQIPSELFTDALGIVARHITEWELLDAPKPYHFPLEMADPHDRQFLSAHLTARVLTDPRNRAPELELLAQLEANGHDVTGARVRIDAMHQVLGMAESRRRNLAQMQALLARMQDACKEGLAEYGTQVQFAGLPPATH